MNFEALESFRQFAKTLNFTHAAEQRHISQPALHKQIRNLSDTLGVELYVKEGRTLRLTEAGVSLARFSTEVTDRVDCFINEVKHSSSQRKITFTAGRGSYLYLLGEALREFTHITDRQLQLQVTNSEGTLSAIRCGEAHMGVTVLSEIPDDLQATLLHQMTPRLIVPTGHPLARRKTLSLKDLNEIPMIIPPSPSPMREMIMTLMNESGFRINVVLEADGWEMLMHFASLGIGATIVNGCCKPPKGTVAVKIPALPQTRYYLLCHSQGYYFPELEQLHKVVTKNTAKVKLFG